jgi:hypothetical protein
MSVPSSEACIQSSNEGQCVVDDYEFLVMGLFQVSARNGSRYDIQQTQYNVISPAFSKTLWSGCRSTWILPWPFAPSGQRPCKACFVCRELQVNACVTCVTGSVRGYKRSTVWAAFGPNLPPCTR